MYKYLQIHKIYFADADAFVVYADSGAVCTFFDESKATLYNVRNGI